MTDNAVTTEVVHLKLVLSEFAILEEFQGFYLSGDRRYDKREPQHRLVIRAEWRYAYDSDKILINGREIQPGILEIHPETDKTQPDQGSARPDVCWFCLVDHVFRALVEAVRRGDTEQADAFLTAEAYEKTTDVVKLNFGQIRIRDRTVGEAVAQNDVLAQIGRKRLEIFAAAVIILLFLILIQLWRR